MAKTLYKVASIPDTVVILEKPLTKFALWESSSDGNALVTTRETQSNAGASKKGNANTSRKLSENTVSEEGEEQSSQSKSQDRLIDREHEDCDSDTSSGDSVHTQDSVDTTAPYVDTFETLRIEIFRELGVELSDDAVMYLVSSAHIQMASPTFAQLLSEASKPSSSGRPGGRYYIRVDTCDDEAMLVLLNIVHLRNSEVPRTMDLEELTKIAILIEHYGCFEATGIFTEMWIDSVKKDDPPPETYCRKLMLWLYVAWVFKMEKIFGKITATALRYGDDGTMRTLGLPIPQCITEDLDYHRCEAILDIKSHLTFVGQTFRDANYKCPFSLKHSLECGAILLGGFLREMDAVGFSSPSFGAPFDGLSYDLVVDKVRRFKPITWYHSRNEPHHPCIMFSGVTLPTKPVHVVYKLRLSDYDTNTRA